MVKHGGARKTQKNKTILIYVIASMIGSILLWFCESITDLLVDKREVIRVK